MYVYHKSIVCQIWFQTTYMHEMNGINGGIDRSCELQVSHRVVMVWPAWQEGLTVNAGLPPVKGSFIHCHTNKQTFTSHSCYYTATEFCAKSYRFIDRGAKGQLWSVHLLLPPTQILDVESSNNLPTNMEWRKLSKFWNSNRLTQTLLWSFLTAGSLVFCRWTSPKKTYYQTASIAAMCDQQNIVTPGVWNTLVPFET